MASKALTAARKRVQTLELKQASAMRKAALAKGEKSKSRWRDKASAYDSRIYEAREKVYGVMQREHDRGRRG